MTGDLTLVMKILIAWVEDKTIKMKHTYLPLSTGS